MNPKQLCTFCRQLKFESIFTCSTLMVFHSVWRCGCPCSSWTRSLGSWRRATWLISWNQCAVPYQDLRWGLSSYFSETSGVLPFSPFRVLWDGCWWVRRSRSRERLQWMSSPSTCTRVRSLLSWATMELARQPQSPYSLVHSIHHRQLCIYFTESPNNGEGQT